MRVTIGTNNPETIVGSFGRDFLYGRGGDDWLDGSWGNDTLYGDAGIDVLVGKWGNDRLYGGEGADLLTGGWGQDRLDGGAGNDTLFGDRGKDHLTGGDGFDNFFGGKGRDTFHFRFNDPDYIHDFQTKKDKLVIDMPWDEGKVAKNEFIIGDEALTAKQHFVYDQDGGSLYYDPDGSEDGEAYLIARFTADTALSYSDLFMV